MQPVAVAATVTVNTKRKRNLGQNAIVQSTMLHISLPTPTTSGRHNGGAGAASSARGAGSRSRVSERGRHGAASKPNQDAGRTLDGFMLLDCCHVEFPDEISQAVLAGLHISSVVGEDLLFFSSLTRLDLSDNDAPFEPFACLPQLSELDFQCNALQHVSVPANGFLNLEVLNLSFNCLATRDIEELSKLLRIRELYLGSNWIRALPPVMDRFSKLETLSLEHNNLSGHEVFNFLAMMPRLRNLNMGHNRITAFPESALSVDGKRGAGLYHLVYLNLAHNKICDDQDVVFTGELHSLRKLVLYGNPLTHAAVASHDPSKLNYDPIPSLNSYIAETEREIAVLVAYPDTKKKRNPATAGTYENVDIYKMLPNEVPLPSPFRTRATNSIGGPDDKKQDKNKPKQSEIPPPQQRLRQLGVDTSDSTFLTGVGIEDILSPATNSVNPLSELPAVPASVITRSLEVNRNINPLKARAAINALRYQLQHPLTSHDDSDLFPISSQRPTQAQIHRQLPRHPLQPERQRSVGTPSSSHSPLKKPFTTAPSLFRPLDGSRAIDDALTQLSHQVAKTWDKRQQLHSGNDQNNDDDDDAINSLVSTAQKVSLTFHPPA